MLRRRRTGVFVNPVGKDRLDVLGDHADALAGHFIHGRGLQSRLNEAGQILVMWPSGASRTVHNYATHNVWTMYPGERLGNFDGDGLPHDAIDHQGIVSCLSGATPGSMGPGCEMMDLDGMAMWISVPTPCSRPISARRGRGIRA
jgi:hypothetical protein